MTARASNSAACYDYFFCLHSRRINKINRIVPHIGVQINPILIPDGIGLEEPAKRR
jgi:hypothetical protein